MTSSAPSEHRRRRRYTRRLAVFGPAAIVVLTGVLSYISFRRTIESRDWVVHTHRVLDASSQLLTSILDAESGARGYILNRSPEFLESYAHAPARADSALARMRALTSDNPIQQRRLDLLTRLTRERIAVIDTAVAAAHAGQSTSEIISTGRNRGKILMDSVRDVLGDMQADEQRLLAAREDEALRSNDLAFVIIVAGTLIAAVLAFFVNGSFDRALRDRRVALDDLQIANERLQDQAIELEHQADASQAAALEAEQATEQAQQSLQTAEEAERRAERLQAATEAFTGALALDAVANLIVEQSIAAVGAQSGALLSRDEDNTLRFAAAWGVTAVTVGSEIPFDDQKPLTACVREGRVILLETPEAIAQQFPAIVDAHRMDGVQALAAYPLQIDRRVVGGLLIRFNSRRALSAADRAFMSAMSRIAAETFERARSFEAERAARTEAEGANRAKAAFLASMSHELRTPLQAALGFAQLVRSGVYGPVNEQQGEVLGRVERSQLHLSRLIDDILDFARLEAGRVRVNLEPVAVSDVLAELAPIVQPQADGKHVAFEVVPAPQSLRVMADRHRLHQILLNLVGNAIKFTPSGGKVVVRTMPDGTSASIHVVDTGLGIPTDRLQSIFEPFVQVDDALTRTASGAGLGLAISRDLAKAIGGELTVKSELGTGSDFSVTLPLA